MKNRLLALITLIAAMAVSCSKDILESGFNGSALTTGRGEEYMKAITQGLIADNLIALENALEFDALGGYPIISTQYKPGGKSLWTPGADWTTDSVLPIKGLHIIKEEADSVWTLKREGLYSLYGNSFQTEYEMVVHMRPGGTLEGHHDWSVEVKKIARTEADGYSSNVLTSEPFYLYMLDSKSGWDAAEGSLWMNVFKDGKVIDAARITYSGGIMQYRYRNGL